MPFDFDSMDMSKLDLEDDRPLFVTNRRASMRNWLRDLEALCDERTQIKFRRSLPLSTMRGATVRFITAKAAEDFLRGRENRMISEGSMLIGVAPNCIINFGGADELGVQPMVYSSDRKLPILFSKKRPINIVWTFKESFSFFVIEE